MRTYGSVRGAISDDRPYRDSYLFRRPTGHNRLGPRILRVSHDSGDPRESAKSVANCYLPAASLQIQTRSSSFNCVLPPFHEDWSCFCTKPASYSLPWALSACCNPNNERGLRG